MRCSTATNIGLIRDENQDEVKAMEIGGGILTAVCDGMGGERMGSRASQIAIREFFENFAEKYVPGSGEEHLRSVLKSAISSANGVIYTTARMDYKSHGMGTTCVAAYIERDHASIVNVGDSRAYLYEDGILTLLTQDHTVVNMLFQQGKISREQMRHHEQRHMLTRAVGVELTVLPDYFRVHFREGAMLLLCSDGLSSYCEDYEIKAVLEGYPFEMLPQELVNLSLEKGGRDNVSISIIKR